MEIFVILWFVLFFFIIAKGIGQWIENENSPVLTVPATIVDMRKKTHHHHHNGHHHHSRTYHVTFEKEGEAGFRAWETKALAELGKRSGLVIATGGGCVTQERNYDLLHQNGTIFCLTRDLHKLPTKGRPLSQATDLMEMYRVRKPLYHRFADHHIDNDHSAKKAAEEILNIWEAQK